MTNQRSIPWVVAALLMAATLGAQQAPASASRQQQRTLDSLATALRTMQRRLDSLQQAGNRTSAAGNSAPARAPGAYMNVSLVGLTDVGWSTADDLEALQVGDHDPRVRGFTIPNAEVTLDGAVDPYFKGAASVVNKLDANGETGVELEEMYFLTTSLPANVQIKAGQFLVEFGRQNAQHPHAWAFADVPLVLGRILGPEGLRSQGARVSWLLPTTFYAEATLGVLNSIGGTTAGFRSEESGTIHGGIPLDRTVLGPGDLLYVPRFASSFDLTGTQTLLVGVSGAYGPNNTGPDARTRIVGTDIYWKWKSPTARQGFPFVAFQGEALTRRYDAAARSALANPLLTLPSGTIYDNGAYGQVLWGIRPMLVAAARLERTRVSDNIPTAFAPLDRENRSRFSTNLTWFPTEYSKLRLQYNHDRRAGIGSDNSVWAQFEFLLGAHAAHKF